MGQQSELTVDASCLSRNVGRASPIRLGLICHLPVHENVGRAMTDLPCDSDSDGVCETERLKERDQNAEIVGVVQHSGED